MRISARNQLSGSVVEVTPGAVTTTVKVRLSGGDVVTSSITKEAADARPGARQRRRRDHQGQ